MIQNSRISGGTLILGLLRSRMQRRGWLGYRAIEASGSQEISAPRLQIQHYA